MESMEVPPKKRLKLEEFLHKVLLELPVLSASEMEQAHMVERHLGLEKRLEDELMCLRWWYLTHVLFGMLVYRGKLASGKALKVVGSFIALRDRVLSQLPLDFAMRCEFYEKAIQDDTNDEGHGFHLFECFQAFVGKPNAILREFYYASLMGITHRLTKAVDRFEIADI
jgi:hypothetical protein